VAAVLSQVISPQDHDAQELLGSLAALTASVTPEVKDDVSPGELLKAADRILSAA
jgi:hypothetical protein